MVEVPKERIEKRFRSLCALPESDSERLRTAAESIEYWAMENQESKALCVEQAKEIANLKSRLAAYENAGPGDGETVYALECLETGCNGEHQEIVARALRSAWARIAELQDEIREGPATQLVRAHATADAFKFRADRAEGLVRKLAAALYSIHKMDDTGNAWKDAGDTARAALALVPAEMREEKP